MLTRLIGPGLAALLATGLMATGAGATVPPKDCGKITVKSKRYQIKADQMRCDTAKTYSRRYLSRHARPSGYRCRSYSGGTALKFRCSKRVKVFFAIRR
jgi:hypothetical protein